MPRWFICSALLLGFPCALLPLLAAEDAQARSADRFFAGTVKESTPEKIVVARTVRGKAESREFRLHPDTKIEGALAENVRVTVRYISEDDGDLALLIVVRQPPGRAGRKKSG